MSATALFVSAASVIVTSATVAYAHVASLYRRSTEAFRGGDIVGAGDLRRRAQRIQRVLP